MKLQKRLKKRLYYSLVILFLLMNIVAFFHAYKFTHFANTNRLRTQHPETLSAFEKLQIIFFGVTNPRPINASLPTQQFETIQLQSNKRIECWNIKIDRAKGSVILFHGYGGEKSSMLDKANEFISLGYNVLLVDFMGSGGSEGNQTTIGYKEAEEVKTAFDYLTQKGEKNICLFGSSMGSVAILKAINDYSIQPKAIIIECPFGSMYQTTCARFKLLKVPSFPMVALLTFWGGVQNGFWAFGHNPVEYAKQVQCPTLLLYGEKDPKVSRSEINEIFANLPCKKELKTYPLAGHENYLVKYKQQWISEVRGFIKEIEK